MKFAFLKGKNTNVESGGYLKPEGTHISDF